MACPIDWGIVWSVLNFICGLAIVIGHLGVDDPCDWLRILIGISICWVAITNTICDQYALLWFPFWNKSFIFMGSTFLFFSCGAWKRGCNRHAHGHPSRDNPDNNCGFFENFAAFLLWFTLLVGVIYIILGFIEFCGAGSFPHPVPLEGCCGGVSTGGGTDGSKHDHEDDDEDGEGNEDKDELRAKGTTSTAVTKKKRKKKPIPS
eukprot:181888_1